MLSLAFISAFATSSVKTTQVQVEHTTRTTITHTEHNIPASQIRLKPNVVITLYPGSLHDNLRRIAAQFGWRRFIWNAPYDYNWVGYTQIKAKSLADAVQKILAGFPLQAVFYEGNKVLAIQLRTLR